jgi:hypothetical protein
MWIHLARKGNLLFDLAGEMGLNVSRRQNYNSGGGEPLPRPPRPPRSARVRSRQRRLAGLAALLHGRLPPSPALSPPRALSPRRPPTTATHPGAIFTPGSSARSPLLSYAAVAAGWRQLEANVTSIRAAAAAAAAAGAPPPADAPLSEPYAAWLGRERFTPAQVRQANLLMHTRFQVRRWLLDCRAARRGRFPDASLRRRAAGGSFPSHQTHKPRFRPTAPAPPAPTLATPGAAQRQRHGAQHAAVRRRQDDPQRRRHPAGRHGRVHAAPGARRQRAPRHGCGACAGVGLGWGEE